MAAKKVKPIRQKRKFASKLEGRTIKKVLNYTDNYLRVELDNGEHFEVGATLVRGNVLKVLATLDVYVCLPGSEPA